MAFKSIIDIDINDAKFKEFLESFQKYKDTAAEVPEDWHKLARAISGAGEEMRGFGRQQQRELTGASNETRALSRDVKHAAKAQDGFTKSVKSGSSGLKGFGNDMGAAALGLDALTSPIAMVVAGIAAIGLTAIKATLSLDKLTASKIKSAKELGMTTAGQLSFETYGSQLFSNPNAMIGAARNAKLNPAESVPFKALGISSATIAQDSAAQLAFSAAKHAHTILKSTPQDLRGIKWQALTQGKLGGYSQAELFANTRSETIAHYKAEYEKHEHAFAISPAAGLRAVKVVQGAGELIGNLTTRLENAAASKIISKGAMATIRGGRIAINDTASFLTKVAKVGISFASITIKDAKVALNNIDKKLGIAVPEKNNMALYNGGALQGIMERDKGTSREPAAVAAMDAFKKLHPFWNTSKYNWRQQHNPGDVKAWPGYKGPQDHGYVDSKSDAANYRLIARSILSYKGPATISSIMDTYVGRKHPIHAADKIKNTDAMLGIKNPTAPLNLSDPTVLAKVVTAIVKTENPHKRSLPEMLPDVLKALQQIAKNTGNPPQVHVHSKTGPGSRVAVSTHAAAH